MSNKSATRQQPLTEPLTQEAALGHGNSPAAWTCVAVMLLGALVSCIAFVIGPDATVAFIIGIVVMILGLGLGFGMKVAGYGVGGSKLKNTGH
ncbi:HGxxPAAW family protein [Specibacter cremeus]|uniref:HGxxPAAW family protein n=1 Tax=Specibacter cremeus TaxID=1629051 RepID=UPI000F7B3A3D|nr:HGxxPAAW family protein [Specibacter cremeus]